MADDTPLRNPAHQLFIQEALELLQQIDSTLQEVLQIPSKKSMDFLLDITETLYKGAQSFDLILLASAAQTFKGLMLNFQKDPLAATPDDTTRLKQAYKETQIALGAYIPGPAELEAGETESVSLTSPPESLTLSDVSFESSEAGNDVTSLILTTEVAEILEQLHQALIDPQVYDLVNELKTQTEALLGWGEVLELGELITIAQSTLEMLESNPQSSISIGQLSLAGFQAAHRTALQDMQADSLSLQPMGEGSISQSSPPKAKMAVAEIPTAESLSSSDEVTLNTSLLFVWLQEMLLFTIPSDAVVEILIPRAEQMMGNAHQRCLSWQQQFIPIHPLSHLLDQGDAHWPRLATAATDQQGSPTTVFGSSPLIIVQQGGQILALEVSMTRLVTNSELILHIPDDPRQHCPYFCGDTLLEQDHQCGVIDIARLLNEMLDLSPLPIQKAAQMPSSTAPASQKTPRPSKPPLKRPRSQTTILVVDDSQTVRMVVSMALQSAGYQVLEAADGQLALDQLEQHADIHLVLCDVEMPNMNGFEFLEYRCRQPAIADIPVVMLSTCNSTQHQHLANTLGANAYLTKPYEESNLLATLQALIR